TNTSAYPVIATGNAGGAVSVTSVVPLTASFIATVVNTNDSIGQTTAFIAANTTSPQAESGIGFHADGSGQNIASLFGEILVVSGNIIYNAGGAGGAANSVYALGWTDYYVR